MTDALRAAVEQALKVLRAVPAEELSVGEWLAALTALRAALDAAPVAPAVPAGYVLVPVEPTPEMIEAVDRIRHGRVLSHTMIYAAIAAAPQPAAVPSAEPAAWPAKHVSLKQQKTRKLHLTLELDNVEGWPNYWVMRSDARGRCSTPAGCSAHGCHGECLAAPQPAAVPQPLTRSQIDAVMTEHYPMSSLLREEVDAFVACVRDIERALGIGAAREQA